MARKERQLPDDSPAFSLGLSEFVAYERQVHDGKVTYSLVPSPAMRPKRCPYCRKAALTVHKTVPRKVMDVSEFGMPVTLEIKLKRYECQNCGQIITPRFKSIHKKTTTRLRSRIARESFDTPFSEVATRYGLGVSTVRDIFLEETDWLRNDYHPNCPPLLAIADVPIHKKIVVAFISIGYWRDAKTIELIEDGSKEKVAEVLRSLQEPGRLQCVSIAIQDSYRAAVNEVFPAIPVVIGRSYVMGKLAECLEAVGALINSGAYADDLGGMTIKPNRLQILLADYALTPRQGRVKDKVLVDFPMLETPYYLKEGFRTIYECATSRSDAEQMYADWVKECHDNHVTAFDGFIESMKAWHKELFSFFELPQEVHAETDTSAIVRGIQEKDREGYGYRFEMLRTKALM